MPLIQWYQQNLAAAAPGPTPSGGGALAVTFGPPRLAPLRLRETVAAVASSYGLVAGEAVHTTAEATAMAVASSPYDSVLAAEDELLLLLD